MIVVFDLDDTLYPEITFVLEGFRSVALFLEKKHQIPAEKTYDDILYFFQQNGRGHIFDNVLKKWGVFSHKNVRLCLSAYRSHQPQIKLYTDAQAFLQRCSVFSIYMVTDGNYVVQKNKVIALQIEQMFKKIYYTHRYGLPHVKPSPYCFLHICRREMVRPSELVYIGDNPYKDFVGIKSLGFKTVRLRRGNFKDIVLDKNHEADRTIDSFDNIPDLQRYFGGRYKN